MFPISDDNPTLRTPVMTYLLLSVIAFVWIFLQKAGLDSNAMAASVCKLGMVPGELTGRAPLGLAVPLTREARCLIDNEPINIFTPITSMFLHGGWGHIIGNGLFFWVFGNNVEDSMGRLRFLVFYLLCGLIAAGAHVAIDPASPIPTVGASGAISGILGAYLVLYPRVRVNLLIIIIFFIRIIPVPAWMVLIYWFFLQLFIGLPQLTAVRPEASGGVAVWAHIGGFVAGVVLIKLFENRKYTSRRAVWRHQFHPDHP